MICDYCKRDRPVSELEERGAALVCKDRQACDLADDQRQAERLKELRARRRAGDELTDAERGELADD